MSTLQLSEQDLLADQDSSSDTQPLESTTDVQNESSSSSKHSPPSTSNHPTKHHLVKAPEQDPASELTQATELNDQQHQKIVEEQPQDAPLEMSAELTQWDHEAFEGKIQLEEGQEEDDVMEIEHEKPKQIVAEGTISAEDFKRIQNLAVSEETKKMIIEKYFRGPNHSDVKRFKEFERKPTALLYELFSMLYREKPVFEVDPPVVIVKGSNQYTAHHVFNKEKLTSGIGSSKQTAKGAASLKSLQIFAPSLAARCQQSEGLVDNEAPKPTIVITPNNNNSGLPRVVEAEKPLEKVVEKALKKTIEKTPEISMEEAIEKAVEKVLGKTIIKAPTPAKSIIEEVPVEIQDLTVEIEQNTPPLPERKENNGLLGEMEDLLDQQFDIDIEEEKIQEDTKHITKQKINLVDDSVEFFESLKTLDQQIPATKKDDEEDNDEEEFEKMMMNSFVMDSQREEQDPNLTHKVKKVDSATLKKDPLIQNTPAAAAQKTTKASPNDIKCDAINGLQINMSLPNNTKSHDKNVLGEIKAQCRDKGIKKLLEILAEILKKDPKTRIDPKAAFNPEIGKALKFYCSHNVFTKLYMLHCLIHNKEADASLQINVIYYESECFVYLYSTELEQTFMYKSNSVVFSVEMAKYFLIYELYAKCFTVTELIDAMKVKMDKVKEGVDDLAFELSPNLAPQKQHFQQEALPSSFTSYLQKEKPTFQPTYRSQNYSKLTSDPYDSLKPNNSKPVSASRSTFMNEKEYKNKENRSQQRKGSDDFLEIIEPGVAKKTGLRDVNMARQQNQGKAKQVLTEDLDSIFEDKYAKRIPPKRRPVEKSEAKSNVKDQMLDDIDNI